MPRYKQSDTTFEQINKLIWDHLEARDWHTPQARGLAVSISLEANELLEHYQWRDLPAGSKKELAAELADIFIYAFEFAHINKIDIAAAIRKKLEKTAKKYPAAMFKGKKPEEQQAAWLETKKSYRKKGL